MSLSTKLLMTFLDNLSKTQTTLTKALLPAI
jgi:hypothetical protein